MLKSDLAIQETLVYRRIHIFLFFKEKSAKLPILLAVFLACYFNLSNANITTKA